MDTLKIVLWGLLRLGIAYLSLIVVAPIWVLTNSPFIKFYEFHLEALGAVSFLIAVFGFALYKLTRFRELGKLIGLALAGAAVLLLYEGESFRLGGYSLSIHSLFLAALLFIAYLYFVIPSKILRPLLMLLPVSSLGWFIVVAVFRPVNMTYDIIISRHGVRAGSNFSC